MKKNLMWIVSGAAIALGTLSIFAFDTKDVVPAASAKAVEKNNIDAKSLAPSGTFKVVMPAKLDFAGENVPLEDAVIRERLEKEILINGYGLVATNTIIY